MDLLVIWGHFYRPKTYTICILHISSSDKLKTVQILPDNLQVFRQFQKLSRYFQMISNFQVEISSLSLFLICRRRFFYISIILFNFTAKCKKGTNLNLHPTNVDSWTRPPWTFFHICCNFGQMFCTEVILFCGKYGTLQQI